MNDFLGSVHFKYCSNTVEKCVKPSLSPMFHFLSLQNPKSSCTFNFLVVYLIPFILYSFWNFMSYMYMHVGGILSHCRTIVLMFFIPNNFPCLPVGTFFCKKALKEILQFLVLGAKHFISHYIKKSFHPILDLRKLNIFLYRINYHLLTINAIIPSLLRHDLFYKIHS